MSEPAPVEAISAEAGPTTPELVAAWLQLGGEGAGIEKVTPTVAAVNVVCRRFLELPAGAGAVWGWDRTQGATMLAGRLYRRRNSALGMATFEGEGASYVMRNDPDIALLLEIGAYSPPRIG